MIACECMVVITELHTHTHTPFFRAPFHFVPWGLADVFADCVAAIYSFSVNSFALKSSLQGEFNAT